MNRINLSKAMCFTGCTVDSTVETVTYGNAFAKVIVGNDGVFIHYFLTPLSDDDFRFIDGKIYEKMVDGWYEYNFNTGMKKSIPKSFAHTLETNKDLGKDDFTYIKVITENNSLWVVFKVDNAEKYFSF